MPSRNGWISLTVDGEEDALVLDSLVAEAAEGFRVTGNLDSVTRLKKNLDTNNHPLIRLDQIIDCADRR